MVKSFGSFKVTSSGTSSTEASKTTSPYPNVSPLELVITPTLAVHSEASTPHLAAAALTNICLAVAPVCLKGSQPCLID